MRSKKVTFVDDSVAFYIRKSIVVEVNTEQTK